jgi:hypothetical protein
MWLHPLIVKSDVLATIANPHRPRSSHSRLTRAHKVGRVLRCFAPRDAPSPPAIDFK